MSDMRLALRGDLLDFTGAPALGRQSSLDGGALPRPTTGC